MAKQTINIGTTANDGTGDPIRTAFDKVNDNFTELYTDDAGDVNSVTATAPLSGTSTTGAITLSLSDDSIKEVKLDCTNSPTDNYLLSYDSATEGFTWVEAATGDITGVTAGDGLTGGGTSGTVSLAVGVDDSTIELNSDAVRVKDLGIVTGKLANDAVSFAKLENRYTAKVDITTYTGAVSIDWSAGTTFKMGSGLTGSIEFDFTNFKQGQVITFYNLTGSQTITFDSDAGTSETFNKVGAVDYAGGSTNMIQVECIDDSANAIFNYSVAAYTSDTTPS